MIGAWFGHNSSLIYSENVLEFVAGEPHVFAPTKYYLKVSGYLAMLSAVLPQHWNWQLLCRKKHSGWQIFINCTTSVNRWQELRKSSDPLAG
jgi:hypothetical protein